MRIRCRPMRRDDIRDCVDLVASHPTLGPRYGDSIAQLGTAWCRLMGSEAFLAQVFEQTDAVRPRKVAVGTRVFVSDDFIIEIKRPPHFWLGRELVGRVKRGQLPVLSDRQVRENNSRGGLNLVVWDGVVRADSNERTVVFHSVLTRFMEDHKGFLLKELISQGVEADIVELQLRSGGFLVDHHGEYSNLVRKPVGEILSTPHCIGISRDLALRHYGSFLSSLFVYNAPRFSFCPSEQKLLLAALQGGTDEELAAELAVSISAVKKTWRHIYERVAECDPELLGEPPADDVHSERGKAKKHHLIGYLREHIEELRPTVRPAVASRPSI